MVNMVKVVIAVLVFISILAFGIFGKKAGRLFVFKGARTRESESASIVISVLLVLSFVAIKKHLKAVIIFVLAALLELYAIQQF